MINRTQILSFLAGLETFHAFVHAYLSITKTHIEHPVETVGLRATPTFHAVAAVINGAIAVGLCARAWNGRSRRNRIGNRGMRTSFQPTR